MTTIRYPIRRHQMIWSACTFTYRRLVQMSWGGFVALTAAIFLAVNLAFALAYYSLGDAALVGDESSRFVMDFFFSVHTLGTLGYGSIHPVSTGSNLIVTLETYLGMMLVPIFAGLVFARFSHSNNPVPEGRA